MDGGGEHRDPEHARETRYRPLASAKGKTAKAEAGNNSEDIVVDFAAGEAEQKHRWEWKEVDNFADYVDVEVAESDCGSVCWRRGARAVVDIGQCIFVLVQLTGRTIVLCRQHSLIRRQRGFC